MEMKRQRKVMINFHSASCILSNRPNIIILLLASQLKVPAKRGRASQRRFWNINRLALGGQTFSQVGSQVHLRYMQITVKSHHVFGWISPLRTHTHWFSLLDLTQPVRKSTYIVYMYLPRCFFITIFSKQSVVNQWSHDNTSIDWVVKLVTLLIFPHGSFSDWQNFPAREWNKCFRGISRCFCLCTREFRFSLYKRDCLAKCSVAVHVAMAPRVMIFSRRFALGPSQ